MAHDDITAALALAAQEGADAAQVLDALVPMVYGELRRMARRQLAGERANLTLDTTGLVHEAYLKLVGPTPTPLLSRNQFFYAAARAMRQVLVDAARRRGRLKRGAGQPALELDENVASSQRSSTTLDVAAAQVLDLDEALKRLELEHPRPARVVECRFFAGLSVEETADALSVSARTVKSDWALARAWLYRTLHIG